MFKQGVSRSSATIHTCRMPSADVFMHTRPSMESCVKADKGIVLSAFRAVATVALLDFHKKMLPPREGWE